MNDHKQGEMVRHAVDMSLSGLQGDPWLAQRVLANVKGEVKVKKKISVALVFALVVVLIAGIALAVISLRDTARQIVETEQTDGRYVDWPIEKKNALVSALVDLG